MTFNCMGGYTYIFIFAPKHRLWELVRTASVMGSNVYPQSMYALSKKKKNAWENQQNAWAKINAQISFEVTAKLISAFVFATWIVQSLFYLNLKFQASNHLL